MDKKEIGKRFRQLRLQANLTQAEMAKRIEISRSAVSQIESGATGASIDNVMSAAREFNADYRWLLEGIEEEKGSLGQTTLRKKSGLPKRLPFGLPNSSAKEDRVKNYGANEAGIVVATQDAQGNETIPMINYRAAAAYLEGYNSQEWFEELPGLTVPPHLLRSGQHFALQITGDSMHPTLYDSDWVIARLLHASEWVYMPDTYIHVVVSGTRGIVVKRIKNRLEDQGFVRCRSDNRQYPPFSVDQDDIIQIWRVEMKLSAHLPDINASLYDRLDEHQERLDALEEKLSNGSSASSNDGSS